MDNSIFIGFGILVVLLFFASVAIIHMRTIRDDVNLRWYNLADKLQYRQDLVPNLIETVRLFVPEADLPKHKGLIDKTIEIRAHAEKDIEASASKMIVEHDLSSHIKQLIQLGLTYEELKKSTNFMELKKETTDIALEIVALASDYNKKVRHHNSVIKSPFNLLPAVIMRYKKKFIFEFE
ncbi:LemA family protein [Patescibacteria group bacterium]